MKFFERYETGRGYVDEKVELPKSERVEGSRLKAGGRS
jgi:hypothetical protein